MGRGRSLLGSLDSRDYRIYLAGSAISLIGTWSQRVAQDLLVLRLGGEGLELGILMAAQFLPILVLGRWVGAVVDRVDRRRLLIVTQAAAGLLAAALAITVATGVITIPLLIALSAGLGVSSAFDAPARHTFVAELVGDDRYPSAQSLYSIVHNVGRLVGPAVAAGTVALFDLTGAFWLNAVSFVAVIVSLLLVRPAFRAPPGEGHEDAGGFRAIWADVRVRALLVGVSAMGLLGQNVRVVLPILVTVVWASSAADYALLLGAMGVGALLGAPLPALLGRKDGALAIAGLLVAVLAAGALVAAPSALWAVPGMVLLGIANTSYNTGARVGVLTAVAPRRRGTAMSLFEMMFHGSIPAGALALGMTTQFFGPRVALIGAAAVILIAATIAFISYRATPVPT